MEKRKLSTLVTALTATSLLLLSTGLSFAKGGPLTPEMAAKKEMVRKQQEQRITGEKRKSAAAALRAERVKIYKARQAATQDNK